ncbi:MAG: ribbon-helix-helix domain-containing protein [Bacteroidota bacterium]
MSQPNSPNKFLAAGLKKGGKPAASGTAVAEPPVEAPGAAQAVQEASPPAEPKKTRQRPSRASTKHVGGYFDPAVSRQLRQIGLEEDATVQDLVAEALDLLFQSRQQPMIARKPTE